MAETIGTIQGMIPDSVEEWRVSVALDKFGWKYEYQSPIAGGRSRRGGQLLDFLVYTLPINTALYIQGEYFHGTRQEQKDKLLQAIAFGPMKLLVQILYGDQLETQDETDSKILEVFGRSN